MDATSEPSSPGTSGYVSISSAPARPKRKKVLVFTLPDGVDSPFSLLERLLKGCSVLDSAGVQKIPFERVIIASDEVKSRGDFVKNPDLKRQKDLLKLWAKMVPNSTTDLEAAKEDGRIGVSIALTVQDVMDDIRQVAKEADEQGQGCDVFMTGSIYLVGHAYALFGLPLTFTAKV